MRSLWHFIAGMALATIVMELLATLLGIMAVMVTPEGFSMMKDLWIVCAIMTPITWTLNWFEVI